MQKIETRRPPSPSSKRLPRLVAAFLTLCLTPLASALELSDYLPRNVDYDPAIPKPSEVLGFEVGEWHVRHDLLVTYMERLAASSPRLELEVVGHTHERRPLLLLTISSTANLARREEIRERHLRLSEPGTERPKTADMPVVVYLGYSIHGNEASGSNAALVVAYHLAAARGPEIEELLSRSIILLDPSLNPDGLGRFAQWANMHRGQRLVDDGDHREHREGWPSGRTNHYWFDLNRDWLPAQHPESQARLEQFHRWRPNVLTDFHEMGTESTYFFQPGVPSRQNPLTPARNLELTRAIAAYHARAFDRQGRLYYSEETFDDFYYGKGSTYPDINGAIGILFEQASARGHLQESENGPLSFPFAIQNQITTSFSTLAAALELRQELLDYQAEFYRGAGSNSGTVAGYVFGDRHDPERGRQLVELLRRHRIVVHELGTEFETGGQLFSPGSAWVAPASQRQAALLRALFERRLEFADTTFYDISTWTLPLAFGLQSAELTAKALRPELLGTEVLERPRPAAGQVDTSDGQAYAYALEWAPYHAPRALYRLLRQEAKVRVATRPFTAETGDGTHRFAEGTLVVPLGLQPSRAGIDSVVEAIARIDGLDVRTLRSGLTPDGIDLGSPSLEHLVLPRPALVVGAGVSAYDAGEIWHLLDARFDIELPMLDKQQLRGLDLGRYTHLILVDGRYRDLGKKVSQEIRRWVRQGGVLIALEDAISWVDEKVLQEEEPSKEPGTVSRAPEREPTAAEPPEADPRSWRPFGERQQERAKKLVSGAIFEAELDLTHPLAYGYRHDRLPVFRSHAEVLQPIDKPYSTVARYSAEPLMSGYCSAENLDRLRGTPVITAHNVGKGLVVRMADSPNFRAFWLGTQKLFLNALFFGATLDPPRGDDEEH